MNQLNHSSSEYKTHQQEEMQSGLTEGAIVLPRVMGWSALITLCVLLGGGVTSWAITNFRVDDHSQSIAAQSSSILDHEKRLTIQEQLTLQAAADRERNRQDLFKAVDRIERTSERQAALINEVLKELRSKP